MQSPSCLNYIPSSQTYHAKLEQLTTLTTRIKNIARTLGPDFFKPDVWSATLTTGTSDNSPSHRDVTPERFAKLEKELVRGKSEVVRPWVLHLL
jgi:protein regulator of cytokinesis 1